MACCLSDYFREPGCCDFTIKGGVAWHPVVTAYSDDAGTIPVDLSIYTDIKMQIRNALQNSDGTYTLIMNVSASVYGPPANGQILLSLTDAQTTTLMMQVPMPTMKYDLDIADPIAPDSTTIISGSITIVPSYTDL